MRANVYFKENSLTRNKRRIKRKKIEKNGKENKAAEKRWTKEVKNKICGNMNTKVV